MQNIWQTSLAAKIAGTLFLLLCNCSFSLAASTNIEKGQGQSLDKQETLKTRPERTAPVPSTGEPIAAMAPLDDLVRNYLKEKSIPGAALAITRGGRLVYARGFGYADLAAKEAVQPSCLFRIAGVSQAITQATILQLIHRGHLGLNDKVFTLLKLKPFQFGNTETDPRIYDISVQDVLEHKAGFDARLDNGDAIFAANTIATAYSVEGPPTQEQIISYAMGKPLTHEPGTVTNYSNFGYLVLGRIIEEITGQRYEKYVQQNVLEPLGIVDMRIGAALASGRAPTEVKYYTPDGDQAPAILGPEKGKLVPIQYGAWLQEEMDASAGWLASAVDLARFASAFEYSEHFAPLKGDLIASRFHAGYVESGRMPGATAVMVISRRLADTCFVVLFNSNAGDANQFSEQIGKTLATVTSWPEHDLFNRYVNKYQ